MRPRVLALVDGEHYPQVVRAALEQASATADVVAALLLGGTEKLAGDPDYGVPLETLIGDAASSMLEAAARHGADRVLDLSDEPVLSEKRRLWLAANALAAGLAYEGADFELRPPAAEPLDAPGAGDHRHRQAGRQDGGLGARGAPAACGRPRRGGGGDGPRRSGRAGAGGAVRWTGRRRRSCWSAREPGCTRPPTSSRTPCWPASPPSARAAAAAACRAARTSRTWPRRPGWPGRSTPI